MKVKITQITYEHGTYDEHGRPSQNGTGDLSLKISTPDGEELGTINIHAGFDGNISDDELRYQYQKFPFFELELAENNKR